MKTQDIFQIIAAVILFSLAQPQGVVAERRVSAIVRQVQGSNRTQAIDSFADYLAAIPSQEGASRSYNSNGSAQADLLAAREVIFGLLGKALGNENIYSQNFDAGGFQGVNIVGLIPGERTDQQYVLAAHYDSEDNPGADDDGSGVAGLLEAARVLGQHRFASSIVFAFFDQEEERDNGWGRGSQFFAAQAALLGSKIKGVVVLDTIGFNSEGDNQAAISRPDRKKGSACDKLARKVKQAFNSYSGLGVDMLTEEDSSDPYQIYQAGFPSVLVSEETDEDGWPLTPYYHEANDYFYSSSGRPQKYDGGKYIDSTYVKKILKGAVGWAATQAGVIE